MAIVSITAGGSITAGDVVTLDSSGLAHKATALTVSQATAVGVALDSGGAGNLVRVNADSVYAQFSDLTPGEDQFVSVVSGQIANYPAWISGVVTGGYTGGYMTRVGRAVTTSGLGIEIQPPVFVSASGL